MSTTTTLQQGADGYAGCKDTYVASGYSTVNYGGMDYMVVGRPQNGPPTYGLIGFDISGIAATEVVLSAKLRLYHMGTNADQTADAPLDLYAIAAANGAWVEGTGSTFGWGNGENQVGSPMWAKRVYNTADWAGSAGLSTAGTDYNATALAAQVNCPDGSDGWREFTFNAAGIAVLQTWLGVAAPPGFLLRGASATARAVAWLLSRNYATDAALRPQLVIEHEPLVVPDSIGVPCIVA